MDENLEQKYELLVDNILDIIVELDLNGNFIFISPQSVDITGYHNDEIIGTSIYQCIHPNDLSILKNAIKDAKIDRKHISLKFRIKHKNGNYIYLSAKGRSVDIDGKQKIIVLASELPKNKGKLKESENILNKIVDQTFMGFAILQDFEVKFLNPKFSEVIGYSYEEIMNWKSKEVFKIIHPQDREEFISLAQEEYLGNNYALNSFQFRVIKKSGVPIWLEIQTKPINYKGNKAVLIFLQDVTSSKDAEQKLIESEEMYRVLFESSPYAVGLINSKGVIVQVNSNVEKIFGYAKEEILGKSFGKFRLFSEEHNKLVFDSFNKLIKGEIPESQELQLHRKDKTVIWVSMQASIVRLSNETLFQVITQDISERKLAKEKLKESEEKYRLISENANDVIVIVDKNAKIKYVNKKQLKKNFGYTQEEIIGKRTIDFIHPDDLENGSFPMKKLIKRSKGLIETRIRHKKGYYVYVELSVSIFLDNDGGLNQLLFLRNITKRKDAELKLKESEERYRLITEHANDLIDVLDEKFRYEYINEEIHKRVLGYSKEDMIGKFAGKFVHPDDMEDIVEKLREGFEKGIGMTECRIRKKDGTYIWYESKGNIFIDKHGNKKALIMSRDITERRLAEQKLKDSEERLKIIFKYAPDAYYLNDMNGNFVDGNDAAERLIGYKKEQLIGKNFIRILPENQIPLAIDLLRNNKNGVNTGPSELFLKHKGGREIPVEIRAHPIKINNQHLVLGIARDITRRKIAEQKLKESEEKFRHLFEKSPFSIILFDSEGIIKDCNSVTEDIFGFKREDLLSLNYFDNLSINPDHLPITKKRFEQLKEGESLLPQDLKIFRADGNSIWINSQISKIKILNQTYFYSIIQDITNKKILEDMMFELNQNFFNFTSDFQENIQSLTQTAAKLSQGNLVLYAKKVLHDDGTFVQIITSENEVIDCDFIDFKQKYFINEIFESKLETPKFFLVLRKNNYTMEDPFIQKYSLRGAFGKVIKNIDDFTSIIAILYEKPPIISHEEQLVLLLISDAIAIEEKRWQLLEKLEEQNTKLSELDKLKSEFLRRISHELKTPLISIKGYSQLLLYNNKGIFDNDTLSMIEEITRGCVRLENLISELIESSKLESAQVKLKLTFEDLSLLINNSVNELQGVAKSRNQEIILNIHEKLITKFEKERIHEVIGNLLTNAIKYSPPSNSIVIQSEIKDGFYIISVKDKGIGFTPEEKQRLFKQFGKIDRFDQENNLAAEGSGLGLYITKKLVELHGGKIWVESEGRNKGSTFYFTLPIFKE